MGDPVVTIKDVSKSVGARRVLADITTTIVRGQLTGLIGPNGAGKSTLVEIILGFDRDYTGAVAVHPEERVQYVPQLRTQDVFALPMSVREYLGIALTPLYRQGGVAEPDLPAALTHVGVDPRALTQPMSTLSGGEQQRVAIARALLAEPTFVVLDEPLASVDYAARGSLYQLLRHLQQDHAITMLLVSHDIESILPICDSVLCLNKHLHTDCHPSEFADREGLPVRTVHHHCEPV